MNCPICIASRRVHRLDDALCLGLILATAALIREKAGGDRREILDLSSICPVHGERLGGWIATVQRDVIETLGDDTSIER